MLFFPEFLSETWLSYRSLSFVYVSFPSIVSRVLQRKHLEENISTETSPFLWKHNHTLKTQQTMLKCSINRQKNLNRLNLYIRVRLSGAVFWLGQRLWGVQPFSQIMWHHRCLIVSTGCHPNRTILSGKWNIYLSVSRTHVVPYTRINKLLRAFVERTRKSPKSRFVTWAASGI